MTKETLSVRLPAETIAYYDQAAKLAGVKTEMVMRVVLAIQTMRTHSLWREFVTKTEWTVEESP